MKKLISLTFIFVLGLYLIGFAQDEEASEPLSISGSVDTYWKYDFSGNANQPTWFGTDQSSVSLGMVNVVLSQTVGKATFVGDLAFGPRGDGSGDSSGAATAPGSIQNLYVAYSLSDVVTITGGFMGTFIGYEVISPTANFNYSGSYLFSNGPFQNAGIKADFAISDKVGLMVGLFSSQWDSYTADPTEGMDNIGTQLSLAPVDGWDVYLNYITGSKFAQWDITTGYQISDPFYIGLNVSENTKYDLDETGFFGIAGYVQYAVSDVTSFGVRYETFDDKDDAKYSSITFSANIKAGPLTIIPEFRMDSSDMDSFIDSKEVNTDKFSQFALAAVYSF